MNILNGLLFAVILVGLLIVIEVINWRERIAKTEKYNNSPHRSGPPLEPVYNRQTKAVMFALFAVIGFVVGAFI